MKDWNRIYNVSVMNTNFKVSYHSLFGKYGFAKTDVKKKKEKKNILGNGSFRIYSGEMSGVLLPR